MAVLPEPILSCATATADSNTSSDATVAANFESCEVVMGEPPRIGANF